VGEARTWRAKGRLAAKPERDPEEYTDEEIRKNCSTKPTTKSGCSLVHSFCSGFRAGELANFTYADINFLSNIWRVEMKEEGERAEWDAKRKPPIAI